MDRWLEYKTESTCFLCESSRRVAEVETYPNKEYPLVLRVYDVRKKPDYEYFWPSSEIDGHYCYEYEECAVVYMKSHSDKRKAMEHFGLGWVPVLDMEMAVCMLSIYDNDVVRRSW